MKRREAEDGFDIRIANLGLTKREATALAERLKCALVLALPERIRCNQIVVRPQVKAPKE